MIKGSRVLYKPVTMRRGVIQPQVMATVVGFYTDNDQVRIKVDGENIQRKVKRNHLEVK